MKAFTQLLLLFGGKLAIALIVLTNPLALVGRKALELFPALANMTTPIVRQLPPA